MSAILFENKDDFQTFFNSVNFPILYVTNGFIKEINPFAIKLLQFDIHKDFEVEFSQLCKSHHYSLVKLMNDKDKIQETYFIDNTRYVIEWERINSNSNSYFLFGSDLSKEWTAIENLKKSEFFYNNILSNLPSYVYWKDKNSVYMGCNDRMASAIGLSTREDIKGKTDFDFDWGLENAAEEFIDADKKVMRTRKSLTTENIFQAHGKLITVLTNKTPLEDEEGNVIGILAISFDITDRKKLEEAIIAKEAAESENKIKTEFLQNMRHDICTPLNGISGFANIIREETDDPKIMEYATNLIASADSLLAYMNEILDVIRIASGEVPFYKKKFDLKKRIQDVIDLNRAKAQEKNIQIELYYDPTLPQYYVGDSRRLHRIILELVTNALNFTPQGLITISVQFAKKLEQGLAVKIIVTDTGIGIPLDKQNDIFARFKRLHSSFEGVYKGAGLGLTVINQFLDDLKGEIYVESKVGKGTSFTCIIPLQEALLQDEDGVEVEAESMPLFKKPLSKTQLDFAKLSKKVESLSRILVVEDDEIAASVAKGMLELLDCDVDVASTGKKAIEMATENHYDLIFMDIGLPDISGVEATKRIRLQEWNKERPAPIIALTAHAESEDKQLCIEAGMSAVLSKPLHKRTANDILDAFIPLRGSKKHIAAMTNVQLEEEKKLLDITGPIIDYNLGLNMAGNPDSLNEMLDILIASFGEALNEMSEAHQKNDWKKIGVIAHRIKGGCSYCAATRLREASANLEVYLKSKNTGELKEQLYQQMLTEIEAVKHEGELNKFK